MSSVKYCHSIGHFIKHDNIHEQLTTPHVRRVLFIVLSVFSVEFINFFIYFFIYQVPKRSQHIHSSFIWHSILKCVVTEFTFITFCILSALIHEDRPLRPAYRINQRETKPLLYPFIYWQGGNKSGVKINEVKASVPYSPSIWCTVRNPHAAQSLWNDIYSLHYPFDGAWLIS